MAKLLAFAATQYGVVTLAQTIDLGVSLYTLRTAVTDGVLRRPARGVYCATGAPETWHQQLLIKVWSLGSDAVASHGAAARLWKVRGFDSADPEAVRLSRRTDTGKGSVHYTKYLPSHHRTVVDGIPVTSPARTLLDVLGRGRYLHDDDRAFALVNDALRRKIVTQHELRVVLVEAAARGRNGVGVLRRVLDRMSPGYVPTESELEDLVLKVLCAAGLPEPARQRQVGGTTAPVGRVDFFYAVVRLVIEADSEKWHGGWAQQEADRRRDLLLMASGVRVIRVTWRQLKEEPHVFVNAVRAVLSEAAA